MKHLLIFATYVVYIVAFAGCDREENEIDGYYSERPRGRCTSNYDCPKNECSVMGMQRYAEPRCEPLGSIGAPCRMGAEAENKTLYFPHMTMECDNVYMQFCPCAGGLVCHEAECRPARKRPVSINRRLYNSWTRMRLLRQQQQQQQQQNE